MNKKMRLLRDETTAVPATRQLAHVASVIAALSLLLSSYGLTRAESPALPAPAPPLSPNDSLKTMTVPKGFRLELVASEPLINEPSGVCWDERGRLFVCELHGYNLEGQYDIDELNESGEVDHVVRRIQANEKAKRAAKKGTYGTVKMLSDADGDGRMDQVDVWADKLPPCYGICPARGGVVVVCAPDIVFLADNDGDGRAEVREVIFTGFNTGPLERGINAPQWGIDGWIYVGGGHGGGKITGPRLSQPREMPNADFRIKPDGSAIEPVNGRTGTIGFAFDESANRFVTSTQGPSVIAPLPWPYLARNQEAAVPGLQRSLFTDIRVYPASRPHPWRTERANDPGFSKFYTDRYGIEESAPNGFFTSACSPLIYLDWALPDIRGEMLLCEPAQNLIHRSILERSGPSWTAHRAPEEAASEFLASSDPWFHPIALAHGPDGAVWIVDFYREIIEDYSAIPRYLQQHYGLIQGHDRGRIYRLVHDDMPPAPVWGMDRLTTDELVREVKSRYLWRRTTARRLLVERGEKSAEPELANIVSEPDVSAALNALYTIDELGALSPRLLEAAMSHAAPAVRIHALRLADRRFAEHPELVGAALQLLADDVPTVQLQLALSLGESDDHRVIDALGSLARRHGEVAWMHDAILSSLSNRGGEMLAELLSCPGVAASTSDAPENSLKLRQARGLLEPLCAAIAARRNPREIAQAIANITSVDDPEAQELCLRGLVSRFPSSITVVLSADARQSLQELAERSSGKLQDVARTLVERLRVESAAERAARLSQAIEDATDLQLPVETRLYALAQIDADGDPALIERLLDGFSDNTPQLREAILKALFSRRDRLPIALKALTRGQIPASALSAMQRSALVDHPQEAIRREAASVLTVPAEAIEEDLTRYLAALKAPRDFARGESVFRHDCAACHRAHGVGTSVGPDLIAEFQRAEETIVRDILAPSDAIASGYTTYVIETVEGRVLSGLVAEESANSILLRAAEGKEQSVLRKDVEALQASPISLMPDGLAKALSPQDVADVIAWLRRPPTSISLMDDDPAIIGALNRGGGTAELVSKDAAHGKGALRVTPPQRYSPQIEGWKFIIREKPQAGEYRFMRFAWKSAGATGVMIELANNQRWPEVESEQFRYFAGRNSSGWRGVEISPKPPADWTVVTRDLWNDFGDATITGVSFVAMEGAALFDQVELLREEGVGQH